MQTKRTLIILLAGLVLGCTQNGADAAKAGAGAIGNANGKVEHKAAPLPKPRQAPQVGNGKVRTQGNGGQDPQIKDPASVDWKISPR